MKNTPSILFAVFALLVVTIETRAASTINWNGTDTQWGTSGNWTGAFASGVSLYFAGTAATTNTNNLASLSLGSVTINAASSAWNVSGSSVTMSGTLSAIGSNPVTWNINTTFSSAANTNTISSDGTLTIGGVISGGSKITKSGNGLLVLSASNAYSGGTVLKSGSLRYDNVNALGSGAVTLMFTSPVLLAGVSGTLANDLVGLSSAMISFNVQDYTVTLTGNISGQVFKMLGSGTMILSNSGNTQGQTGINKGVLQYTAVGALGIGKVSFLAEGTLQAGVSGTLSNTIDCNSLKGVIDTQGNTVVLNGAIVNSGTLCKAGSGVLAVGSDNSAATTAYSIKAGTLRYDHLAAFGDGAISFDGNSTLRAGVAGEFSASTVNVSAGVSGTWDTAGLAVSSSAAVVGSGTLSVAGNGSLTLSGNNAVGAINIKGGATCVNSGMTASVVSVDPNSRFINTGLVTGTVGVSGIYSGAGTVEGSLIIRNMGELTPGDKNLGTTGTVTVSGSLLVENGAMVSMQVAAGGLSDQIVVTDGSVTLETGSILNLTLAGSLPGGRLVLIDNQGTSQISGTFGSVWVGGAAVSLAHNGFSYNGSEYLLVYNVDAGGDGHANDVELLVVPEPAVGVMLVGGLGLLCGYARLRRGDQSSR